MDASGNPINIPYNELDKMRVSCHTLREFRPGIGGHLCEVLYQLITSLDCFTLHWTVDNPDIVDHFRVYQIKIDSGVAKLLGHVVEPYFKVTWFEIPDYEKDEAVHHFKFVVRPILKNGLAVPLDYTYCKLFHIASKKETACLVTESCTGMLDGNMNGEKDECDGAKCQTKENGEVGNDEAKSVRDNNVVAKHQTSDNIEKLTEKLHLSDE